MMQGTWKGLFSLMNASFLCMDQEASKIAESWQVNARTRCMRRFKTICQLWYGAPCQKGGNRGLLFEDINVKEVGIEECYGTFWFPSIETIQKA